MDFYIENGVWSNVFAVPCEIVDSHIKLCSPLSLKVLMVMLRFGGDMDIDALSGVLGQSRADVQDAINYWITNGIIFSGERAYEADSQAGTESDRRTAARERRVQKASPALSYTVEPDVPPEDDKRKIVSLTSSRPRLTTREINEMAEKDPSIGHLLQETQSVMGKPLAPVATDVISALYIYYGMEPDIILMLIQYCVSIGKDSVHYIEKAAASWIEKGINSHELAEAEIIRLTKQKSAEGQIRSMFGINDRALVSNEKKYIDTWINEWKLELPLIEVAFERTVELKGKLSFAYINGILGNWHETRIETAAQAMQEINKNKGKSMNGNRKPAGEPGTASYDMSKLESLITSGENLK